MAKVKPFRAVRPRKDLAKSVASLPYDVVNEKEARNMVADNPYSFMKIVRPETAFPEGHVFSGNELYDKARDLLYGDIADGVLTEDSADSFYIYRQMAKGRIQTGLVACFSADDYITGIIRQHELTRKSKEEDRICHISTCGANTGLVYLAYKNGFALRSLIAEASAAEPVYDFFSEDNVRHIVWRVSDPETVRAIALAAGSVDAYYIADGHHRAASAAAVCRKKRIDNPDYTGDEEFNYFLAAAFPADELMIMPYYRVVKDLNGHSPGEFLDLLSKSFDVSEVSREFTGRERLNGVNQPARKNEIAMYLHGTWYRLNAKEEILKKDPVGVLDVSLLQENVLGPLLGITDPRTSSRIDFVGGIRGMAELERRCSDDMEIAFALYPTSMDELMDVADASLYMPPKSTWFEPKLQSGLFIHMF